MRKDGSHSLLAVLLVFACLLTQGALSPVGAGAAEPEASDTSEPAETSGTSDENGWNIDPYLTLGVAAWVQEYAATVTGTNVIGGINTSRSVPLTTLFVDLEAGILGPEFRELPGRPRPFLRGGVLMPTNGNSTIQAGTQNFRPPGQASVVYINSQKTQVEWDPIYTAGLGIEFQIRGDLGIRLSPSLEFRKTTVRYEGKFERVETRQNIERGRLRFAAKRESGQSYLGPGLRAAIGFDPFAGVTVSGYLDAALLFDIDGTHENFGATNRIIGTVDFDFEAKTWAMDVGTGFTIAW